MSVLQIGTRGKYEDRTFELVGRAQYAWEGGKWTEWRAEFLNGKIGWLAEAQGDAMLTFEIEDVPPKLARSDCFAAAEFLFIEGKPFTVVDVKTVRCVETEGTIPEVSTAQADIVVTDLANVDGGFGSLVYSEDDRTRLFIGRYVELSALELTKTKRSDGW